MTVCKIYHINTIIQIIPPSGKLSPFVDLLYFQYYKCQSGPAVLAGLLTKQSSYLHTTADIDQSPVCKIQPHSGAGPS